jgi:glycosyltransferase involved in cell wall biosynthesis
MLESLRREYGLLPPSRVILNGGEPLPQDTREKEPFVLTAGRVWDEAKNVDALDRVAGALPWPVYVAGEATSPDGRRRALRGARALGPLDRPALGQWMSRAAIYALPARYEPFGLTVLEAALAGCALVLGDIPSLRELWDGAALFVPSSDDGALVRAIEDLCHDAHARERLAAHARRRAASLTPERMAEQYHAAYATLMRSTPRFVLETVCAS